MNNNGKKESIIFKRIQGKPDRLKKQFANL